MYLPLAAVLALMISALHAWPPARRAVVPAAIAVAVLLGGMTIDRNHVYASDERVWEDTIDKAPSNARAHHNYAVDLLKAGRVADAESHARTATTLKPQGPTRSRRSGVALLALGRADEGIAALERARTLGSRRWQDAAEPRRGLRREGRHATGAGGVPGRRATSAG